MNAKLNAKLVTGAEVKRGRNVTSGDLRKAPIVAALKSASGATKVTLLVEVTPGVFQGNCIIPKGANKGVWQVEMPELARKA